MPCTFFYEKNGAAGKVFCEKNVPRAKLGKENERFF